MLHTPAQVKVSPSRRGAVQFLRKDQVGLVYLRYVSTTSEYVELMHYRISKRQSQPVSLPWLTMLWFASTRLPAPALPRIYQLHLLSDGAPKVTLAPFDPRNESSNVPGNSHIEEGDSSSVFYSAELRQ